MKKLIKNDLVESICIALSYILLWAPAVFISVDLNADEFLVGYGYRTWTTFYVGVTCLFLFHVLYLFIRRMRFSVISVVLSALILIFILTIVHINWLKLGMRINTYPESEESIINNSYVVRSVIYQLYGISYFLIIKLFLRHTKLKIRSQELAIKQKTSELNFLKSQTNPHFLFNTLNSIYALARDKSDLTADTVMRLSDILRYMLYETQAELISVAKEIEIIEEYLELEKIRYDDSLQIVFEKNIDSLEQKIPPLLLIHLIENAFKHGASETIDAPLIKINLSIKGNMLLLSVENSTEENQYYGDVKDNIGLSNLRRQLSLLFKEHQLNIKRNQNSFFVSMEINLDSYAKN